MIVLIFLRPCVIMSWVEFSFSLVKFSCRLLLFRSDLLFFCRCAVIMGGRERSELVSPLMGLCLLFVRPHGQSVAPVAAAQLITRIAPPGQVERKPLAIPPQHFGMTKAPTV